MNILVCIGIVPDTTSKLIIDSSSGKIDKQNLTMIIGPYEEYALSKAIELKETLQCNVSVLYVGNNSAAETVLRKCLAIGADDAFRIDTEASSSKQVADEISSFIESKGYDLILMGKESIDTNNGLVHRLVANRLQYHHFNPVMKLKLSENESFLATVEVENGTSELLVNLPLVLGCQEPIAEWKIPSMRGIMTARTKPLTVLKSTINNQVLHLKDEVIEMNRKQKVFKSDEIAELGRIINEIIK
jgi:electron transfer flavoprotein beta subunit